MKVKKYIEIPEEILVALAEGKYVEGSLHRDKDTCRIVFNVYNRKPRKRLRDIIIRYLEHGWVKESAERIKIYESIPKVLGTAHIRNQGICHFVAGCAQKEPLLRISTIS